MARRALNCQKRRFPAWEVTASNLLPIERPEFSDDDGQPKAKAELPRGWTWAVDVVPGKTDCDGWVYAFNWDGKMHFDQFAESHTGRTWVRRRRWLPLREAGGPSDDVQLAEAPADGGVLVVEVWLGRGRIFTLHHRPSTSYQIFEHVRCLYF
jgi:hypothetical protein